MPSHNDQTPDAFAAGYLGAMQSRWSSPIGTAIQSFMPTVFPGAPAEAILGFTTEAGTVNPATDDTATDGSNNSFHEIGYFQTEAGPASGPAPNPDSAVAYNNWGQLASDSTVTSLLGHAATMVADAWKTAIPDQAAVGMVNIRKHARAVAAQLPASIRPSGDGTLWAMAMGFMGFGAGDGGAAQTVNRYASQLATVDEAHRWGALIDAVLTDAHDHGGLPGTPGHHGNPAFDVLRAWQKLATGKALATANGNSVAWFDTGLGAQDATAQQGIDDAAYGRGVASFTRAVEDATFGYVATAGLATLAWRYAFGTWPWDRWL